MIDDASFIIFHHNPSSVIKVTVMTPSRYHHGGQNYRKTTKIVEDVHPLNGTQFHEDQPKSLQMGSLQILPWPSKCYGSWDYHFRTESFVQLPNNRCKSFPTLENSPYHSSSGCERKLRFQKTFFQHVFHRAKIRQIHSNLWRSFSSDVQILFSEVDIFNQTKKRCHMILFMTYPPWKPIIKIDGMLKWSLSRQHLENYLAKWLVGGLGPGGLDSWDRKNKRDWDL